MSSLEYDEDDYEDENTCLPQLADHCFSELYKNLACHLDPTYTQNCHKRDADYLCRSSLDALNCASDIIDGDCSLKQGRLQFDSWMAGLKGVYSSLCKSKQELLKCTSSIKGYDG
ncbi:unnamed protein product, partial [Timema podura]|nr:unnamed protein product [Timema podura]